MLPPVLKPSHINPSIKQEAVNFNAMKRRKEVNVGQHVLTVCACQATFLMFKISQHFEHLLLD